MQTKLEEALNKFYNHLYIASEKEKKIIDGSVFKTLLTMTTNNVHKILKDSSLPSYKVDRRSLEILSKDGSIRRTDKAQYYAISAKGLWKFETKNNILDEDQLIEFFDEKKFNPYKKAKGPLRDKDKIIVFFMIAVRAFSEKSPIVTKNRGEVAEMKLKEVIDKSADMLASLGFIPKIESDNDIYGKKGNEYPGGAKLLRRTDELQKKTGRIFKSLGNNKFCLDLYDGVEFSINNLQFLFKKIFDNKILTPKQVDELDSFFRDISFKYNIHIFNPKEHIFSEPEYDNILREAMALL